MRKLYILAILAISLFANAQNPAVLDLTFNTKDYCPSFDKPISQAIVQPDGKIIVVGPFKKYTLYGIAGVEMPSAGIVRLNADMSVDTSFNVGLGFTNSTNNGQGYCVALQADGKILVGGNFQSYNGAVANRIARLNTDGSLDTTFTAYNSMLSSSSGLVRSMKILPDNKILLIGSFEFSNFTDGLYYRRMTRLTADGNHDATFSTPFFDGSTGYNAMALQPDGKILIGGSFNNSRDVKRFNANGSLDNTFVMADVFAGLANPYIYTMGLQSDGKLVVGGTFDTYNSVTVNSFMRINTNGTVDATFLSGSGFVNPDDPYSAVAQVIIQPDNKIIVTGGFKLYNGTPVPTMVRLNSNGVLDNTFNASTDRNYTPVSLQPDGNLIVALQENNESTNYGIHWVKSDGKMLQMKQASSSFFSLKVAENTNGDVLIAGQNKRRFLNYHSGLKLVDANGKLKFNANLFNGFDEGAVNVWTDEGRDVKIQPDGKILVAGDFSTFNEVEIPGIVRLNQDFSIDDSFSVSSEVVVPGSTTVIALQPDGKILLGGYASNLALVRLNSNGSNDASFSTGSGFNDTVNAIFVQPDGKIIVGGAFTTFNGLAANHIVRLNSDGSRDTSFIIGTGFDFDVLSIAVQTDGKIVVGGGFNTYNAVAQKGVARLNSNGNIDTSFNTGTLTGYVRSLALQTDGKILIAGSISMQTGVFGSAVFRLQANGSQDTAFDIGTGFNNEIFDVSIGASGKIYVAGWFTKYNGTWVNGCVRLIGGDAFAIQGQNKFDANNNGCDVADAIYPNLKLRLTSGATTIDYITDISGNYNIPVAAGSYSIAPISENAAYINVSPANAAVTFPGQASPFIQNFCLSGNGSHPDLEVNVIPVMVARPGFDATYKIVYKNKGSVMQSGSVNLAFDDARTDFVSATPTVSAQAANSLTWNFSNLLPFETREIKVIINLNTPSETPPLVGNDVLSFTSVITSSATDETPNDNTGVLNQVVVNSYDPNDKTCLEGAMVPVTQVGQYVHYVIRFENTGTYAAQNIVVRDMIDLSRFDIASLMPVSGSHPFTTRISEGNKVEFNFEDINLPFDNANNDGYVAFKIKLKSNLVSGDAFSNAAEIYFDYNTAIVTETATTVIQMLSNPDISFGNYLSLYPNPANQALNIYKKQEIGIQSITVYNMLGQLAAAYTNADNLDSIDVSALKSGMYVISLKTDKGITSEKFIKN